MAMQAQVHITVDTSRKGAQVSPDLYGIFYEDINHAADGGSSTPNWCATLVRRQ
jgi:hypothetical protein